MLNYAVAFLVLVIALFVVRMSSGLTTSNLYLASIQELIYSLRQDIQNQETQKGISQSLEKIHQELAKIAVYEETNLPNCAASLEVILDRIVCSLVELEGMHVELKRAAQDLANIAQRRA